MVKYLGILAILTLGSGCCSTPSYVEIDIPARPELIPLTQEAWDRMPPEAQDTVQYNDLALKEYARKLEARIKAYNEVL